MKIKINQIILLAILFTITISKASAGINEELIECCKSGNLECVKALVEKGADVNYERQVELECLWGDDTKLLNPLMVSVATGNIKIVEFLLNYNAEVNTEVNWVSPLAVATKFGNVDIVKLILKKNIQSYYLDRALYALGETPFCTEDTNSDAKTDLLIIRLLIKKGANINMRSGNRSIMYPFTSVGSFEVVKELIKMGMNKSTLTDGLRYPRGADDNEEYYKYLIKAGANRAVLVNTTQYQWWFCDNSYNCINKMRITFENNSFAPISSVTFMLTIKSGSVLYKKKHTAQCSIDHSESAPCKEFMLAEKVYDYDGGGFGDGNNISIDVEVISVK